MVIVTARTRLCFCDDGSLVAAIPRVVIASIRNQLESFIASPLKKRFHIEHKIFIPAEANLNKTQR
jgi:pantothenate kinase type III